ncbi:MAG: 50S ribosomal protein L21 [Bifidobacteriaceae bacterium]|jgi:large subunit ribosomal protein L21|nr:50S ribosomal protein L21 [Bifidobacteriaceae bacterium]
MEQSVVYAIVKAGGHQEKVSVGDEVVLDRLGQAPGESVDLPVLLLVDGAAVTSSPKALAKVKVTAEVLGNERGRKINIFTYKNKTGQHRRMGHRQDLTRVRVTSIN